MTHAQNWLLILIPIAYLLGSIPFGLIVGLSRGVDPRKAGSGNIGATNVGRLLGKKYFAIVFILDLLKGMIPVLLAGFILHFRADDRFSYLLWILVGFVVIIGHMFSIFLGFKGGKGVSTSAGIMLGLFPYYTLAGIIAILIWLAIYKAKRYISLASIIGAMMFPLAYAALGCAFHWPIFNQQLPLLLFAAAVPVLIIIRHRGNIGRLRSGTENRF